MSYVGETERSLRARAQEHGLISHREAHTTHSLQNQDSSTSQNNPPRRSTRPTRNTKRHDYAALHSGSTIRWTEGTTDVSKHLAQSPHHTPTDCQLNILGIEPNWRKRVIKESLAIRRIPSTSKLNLNDGKHHFGPIYDPLIQPLRHQDTQQSSHQPSPSGHMATSPSNSETTSNATEPSQQPAVRTSRESPSRLNANLTENRDLPSSNYADSTTMC